MKSSMSLYEAIQVGHETCKQAEIKPAQRAFFVVDDTGKICGACAIGMALLTVDGSPKSGSFSDYFNRAVELWDYNTVDKVMKANDKFGLSFAKTIARKYH